MSWRRVRIGSAVTVVVLMILAGFIGLPTAQAPAKKPTPQQVPEPNAKPVAGNLTIQAGVEMKGQRPVCSSDAVRPIAAERRGDLERGKGPTIESND